MYIINAVESGGVYAVNLSNNKRSVTKVVLIFEEKDDAERYIGLLKAEEFEDELVVNYIDEDIIKNNCDNFGYEYAVVDRDHLVVPVDL